MKLERSHGAFLRSWKAAITAVAVLSIAPTTPNVLFASASETSDRNGNKKHSFPLLDSFIASGFFFDRLTLEDMEEVRKVQQCHMDSKGNESATNQEDTVTEGSMNDSSEEDKHISDMIRDFVHYMFESKQPQLNKGRVVEYIDTEVELEDNYNARVQGVTMSCFVPYPFGNEAPAVFASHLLSETTVLDGELIPSARSVYAYNISMLLKANVLESPAWGMLYTPDATDSSAALHCLDFQEEDPGITKTPSFDILVAESSVSVRKNIAMGSKANSLTYTRNRVSWIHQKEQDKTDLVLHSYRTPRAEVVAYVDLWHNLTSQCRLFSLSYGDCFNEAADLFPTKFPNLTWDAHGAQIGASRFSWMVNQGLAWRADVPEVAKESIEGIDFLSLFSVPFIFSEAVAYLNKNALYVVYANPYFTNEEFEESFARNISTSHFSPECPDSNPEVLQATLLLEQATHRRKFEFTPDRLSNPLGNLSDWATRAAPFQIFSYYQFPDLKHMTQEVQWNDTEGDSQGIKELGYGNLTEKVMGKTAGWLIATDYVNTHPLQELWDRHDQSAADAYSKAASEAVDISNPCGDAASNGEIYLLVFSMAFASCGGVGAVLQSLHIFFRWAFGKTQEGEDESRSLRSSSSSSSFSLAGFLPPYELIMVSIGMGVFFSLYLPTIVQVMMEIEVSEYSNDRVDLVADYGEQDETTIGGGTPVMVTLVSVKTQCNNARPKLLVGLLVGGVVAGFVINWPYHAAAGRALWRYMQRICNRGLEDEVPEGSTVDDEELRVLIPSIRRRGRKVSPSDSINNRNDEEEPCLTANVEDCDEEVYSEDAQENSSSNGGGTENTTTNHSITASSPSKVTEATPSVSLVASDDPEQGHEMKIYDEDEQLTLEEEQSR